MGCFPRRLEHAPGEAKGLKARQPPAFRFIGVNGEDLEIAASRMGDSVMLDSARERMELQIAASAVWLELDCDGGADMDEVLDFIDSRSADGCFGAVVSGAAHLVDALAVRITGGAVELIVDAGEAERIAALALANARTGVTTRISDIASDQNADRLRQLSDEVSRIAPTSPPGTWVSV